MKNKSFIFQMTILVVVILSFIGVNYSQARIYDFWTAGGYLEPKMYFNFNVNPYVDSLGVSGGAGGNLSDIIAITGVQADTDNFTAVVGHYDESFFSYNYSGQITVGETWIPPTGGFDPKPGYYIYDYLPFSVQFDTMTNSYDSTDVYSIDYYNLDFVWDSPGSESVTFSGQINVDGNISTFDFSRSISWSGSGSFDTTYYPEGLILDLDRNSSGMTSEKIFEQTIDGQLIEFQLDPNDFSFEPRLLSGSIPAHIVPEPVSSTLFIIGGATLGFRRFWEKRKNM
jgi:hypothetical protein